MLGAFPNLLNSEKALLALGLIIAATVLAGLGELPIAQWKSFVENIFLVYVGGKTIQGSTALIASAMKPAVPAAKPEAA